MSFLSRETRHRGRECLKDLIMSPGPVGPQAKICENRVIYLTL